MTEAQVLAAFAGVVRRLAGDPSLPVTREHDLMELGTLDSLRLLEAIALTEAACGVEIDAAGLSGLLTVDDLIRAMLAGRPL